MAGKEETDLLLANYFPKQLHLNCTALKLFLFSWIKTKIELIVPLKAICIIITEDVKFNCKKI